MWPTRDAICLDCRTTLAANMECPAGHRRVTSLGDPAGRSKLLDEVWGPVASRRRLREATRAAAVGGPSASLLDSCTGCDAGLAGDGVGSALLVLLVAFIAIVVVWYVAKLIVEIVRRYRDRPRPNGAGHGGPTFGRAFACGTVVAVDQPAVVDPITSRPAVAYGVELRARGRGVMLRDGASVGFTVELETGERVRVPAGVCVVDASRGESTVVAETYLGAVDRFRGSADVEPFPGADGRVVVIAAGDRVEIHGRLVPTPTGDERGYRDGAAIVLVPDGLAHLRLA